MVCRLHENGQLLRQAYISRYSGQYWMSSHRSPILYLAEYHHPQLPVMMCTIRDGWHIFISPQ